MPEVTRYGGIEEHGRGNLAEFFAYVRRSRQSCGTSELYGDEEHAQRSQLLDAAQLSLQRAGTTSNNPWSLIQSSSAQLSRRFKKSFESLTTNANKRPPPEAHVTSWRECPRNHRVVFLRSLNMGSLICFSAAALNLQLRMEKVLSQWRDHAAFCKDFPAPFFCYTVSESVRLVSPIQAPPTAV